MNGSSGSLLATIKLKAIFDKPNSQSMGLNGGAQRKSLIRTTSLLVVPRPQTSDLPSRDQSKEKKVSAVKWVNCFGGLPSSGWIQRFVTPERTPPWVRL